RGLYEPPGGKVEVGEHLFDGLRREVAEETGLDVLVKAEKFTTVGELEPFVIVSDPYKRVTLFFLAEVRGGSLSGETEEQREVRFYPREEIKRLLSEGLIRPTAKPALEKWLAETS
ncbi:NUDIX hydrolase, partial [Candidatus Azambacteria bacterium]|nr:NUDIX hydrolase [Candidatus Azambacteria bacterium]